MSQVLQSFSDYFDWNNIRVSHNLPRRRLEKMEDYLVEKYADDIAEIGELFVMSLTNSLNDDILKTIFEKYKRIKEDFEVFNSLVEHNTIIGEYKEIIVRKLENLIDALRINKDKFIEEASKDYLGVFIISYYQLYLRFVTHLYLKLKDLKLTDPNRRTIDSPTEKNKINLTYSIISLFAIPLIMYLKKGKIMENMTTLEGIMLYLLAKDKKMADPNSLGHKLFLAVFNG